jgi:hypothetical protein
LDLSFRRLATVPEVEWLPEPQAIEYLRCKGLPVAPTFLRDKNRKGQGPACKYLGVTKLYSPSELNRWVLEELLKDTTWSRSPKKKRQRCARKPAGEAGASP